ncbi:MAG: RRXRR domain-containing protein, partial [Atribacterota bacterium]|nr:RRXRR domain-containing protein [Atribacterota bacterium]
MDKIKNSIDSKKRNGIDKNTIGGRLKSTELPECGSSKHNADASKVCIPCGSQSRWEKMPNSSQKKELEQSWKVTSNTIYVPVISSTNKALMPCHPARARELVRKGKALRRFSHGIFYIKLIQRKDGEAQEIALGIDPGSKREAYTVKSEKHTYLNILSDAVTWVKDAVEIKRNMRRSRRFRKTPCRQNRYNRRIGRIPPSTKSRWNAKLRVIKFLCKLYPINNIVVEDLK